MKMYSSLLAIILAIVLFAATAHAEEESDIPSVNVKNLRGQTVDTKTFDNDGKPFVINFWATWCKPCILELNNISDLYLDWQDETGVKIIAISIDDSRNSKKVAPFVNGRGWEYEVYLDENMDFKRAMNVNNPPHTFLFNGEGELVWEHNSYAPGDEDELYRQIQKLCNKDKDAEDGSDQE